MNIAIVGAGRQGVRLMELIQRHEFHEIKPEITVVVDINANAPGMVEARNLGIYTTPDYRELFKNKDIDLIVELTGDQNVFYDILKHKDVDTRAISSDVVKVFWEISRISSREKKTRQELHEASAMYEMVINDLIQEDVMVINFDYRIADINKTLLEKLGMKRDEVIGRHCYEITHRQNTPCSGDKHPCPLVKTLDTQKPYQTTHLHLDKKDRERYYAISTYPVFEGHDVIGATEISRDITKEINTQKNMMHQERLASIGRLSAGVAHEINNPLTTILTSAMLIQEDLAEDDPIWKELELITRETMRCREIVTSLLNFARQSQPQKKPHDLNRVVAECVLLTKKQAAFKDIDIKSDLAPKMPSMLLDKGQIEQALINLILNAVAATPPGGQVTVTTACCDEKDYARIVIEDTGEGIAEEDLERIFDPFFTTKDSGTGLGLAITHGIIEQHDGRITAKSKVGQGTRFVIYFPILKDE